MVLIMKDLMVSFVSVVLDKGVDYAGFSLQMISFLMYIGYC